MKTKLLKKIRKQYIIVYYPNRNEYELEYPEKGTLRDNWFLFYEEFRFKIETIEQAKEMILIMVRYHFKKYCRKYKLDQVKHKVWYNQPQSQNVTIDSDGDGYSY